jgi:uncharacterized protein involved in copper resistance
MRRRLSALAAMAAALLVCLAGSPAPAQAGDHDALTGAEWHRLHPTLCHTAGDHALR